MINVFRQRESKETCFLLLESYQNEWHKEQIKDNVISNIFLSSKKKITIKHFKKEKKLGFFLKLIKKKQFD